MKLHKYTVILWALYTLAAVSALLFVYLYKQGVIFADDAGEYSKAAIQLLKSRQYSLDGTTPFFTREPGYSVFLAVVYFFSGIENWVAVAIAQLALFTWATFAFGRELSHNIPKKTVHIAVWLLLLHPGMWVAHVSMLRESFTATMLMFMCTCVLRNKRTGYWEAAIAAGACMGAVILLDAPFFLLPICILPALLLLKMRLTHIALFLVACGIVLAPWALRNVLHTGNTCIAGCNRSGLHWAVRGQQAVDLRGLEPLRCLHAEYITRNYDGRSTSCHFNAVKNQLFPNGFTGSAADAELGAIGKSQIKEHLPWYLWHSVFEVLELHLPYVNSWGVKYNALVALYSVVLMIGFVIGAVICLCKLQPYHYLLGALIVYTTGLYALSDALARYLLPVIFCYCIVAAVGYRYIVKQYER